MNGYRGGLEEYGDSMSSLYLGSDVDDDDAKTPPTDPAYNTMYRQMLHTKVGNKRDLIQPPAGRSTPKWARSFLQQQATERGSRPANPRGLIDNPNLERPLSLEKQARIPIDISPEEKQKVIQEDLERSKRPPMVRMPIEERRKKGVRSPKMTAMDTGHIEGYWSGIQDFGVPQPPIISEERTGELLWRAREKEAWADLRTAQERGGGIQTGVVTKQSGEVVSITGKGAAGTDRGVAPTPAPSGPRTPGVPVRTKKDRHIEDTIHGGGEVAVSVMPGYDPKGIKGLYPGKRGQKLAEKTVNVLKGMPVEEALKTGMGIEQAALAGNRGVAGVLRESLRAGERHLETVEGSRQAAEAARQRGIQLMQEMSMRMDQNRALLERSAFSVTKNAEITKQAESEVESELAAANKPRRSRKSK